MIATRDIKRTVIDYLAALVWDGERRLDRWLVDCAGAEDTEYVHGTSRKMLVAAVRRARDPGCRFDQLPVLVGPQGCGKSSALRVLAVEDSWGAVLPLDIDARRRVEMTVGKWIVEVFPLAVSLKAFLAQTHDEVLLPRALGASRVPRQFIAIGTTNEKHFVDGLSARRIVPVGVQHFDLDRLRVERDQLWAEASVVEAAGQAIYLPGMAA